jgi:hypothetical protein
VLQLQLREVAVLTIKAKTQRLFRESRFRNSKRNTNTPISWSEAVSIAPESLHPRRSRQNALTIAKLRYPSCLQASFPGRPLSASAWLCLPPLPCTSRLLIVFSMIQTVPIPNLEPSRPIPGTYTHDPHVSLSYPLAQMISHRARNVSVFAENL